MNPSLDHLLVIGSVCSALAFLLIRSIRSRRSKKCGGGCGCPVSPSPLKRR